MSQCADRELDASSDMTSWLNGVLTLIWFVNCGGLFAIHAPDRVGHLRRLHVSHPTLGKEWLIEEPLGIVTKRTQIAFFMSKIGNMTRASAA